MLAMASVGAQGGSGWLRWKSRRTRWYTANTAAMDTPSMLEVRRIVAELAGRTRSFGAVKSP
eukprot:CAMPEP_0174294944 /NCGR_PEP_ID=MMETSP0809-20121228/43126_1 /TAXON_ID=73025 ORGANISM="Eutreptiella gymnastica-like, Strain CCMP1594" /NCGR_SAMPLE_ID=MMETSP0809 /ASSEMBLY_ACC=CAM_ASM_000658 /LENGTH=61 /DNA_ID=CAMNT_0015396787 /DNA_START=1 /DNA_END=183 /DNA_ORIENTATION=-